MSQRYFKRNSDINCTEFNMTSSDLMYQSLIEKKLTDLRIRGALTEPAFARDVVDECIAKIMISRAAELSQSQIAQSSIQMERAQLESTRDELAKMTTFRAVEFEQSQTAQPDYFDGYRPSGR